MGKKGQKSRVVKRIRAKQQLLLEEDYRKAPHSFVFNRGHVGKNVQQLILDIRRVMEPYTASNLKPRKKNVFKDFVNIAGVLNVTHFIAFSKTETATNMRLMRLPRGPTLTFKVHSYCLAKDVISSLKKPNMEQKQFQYHPLLVMNNFAGDGMHLKLMSSMFQNLFPSININKVDLNEIRRCVLLNYNPETQLIEFRHYNIKVVPVGMSRGVKKLIKAELPDLSKYEDISQYLAQGGNASESEAEQDGEHNEVILPQKLHSRGNVKATKSAIRLTEIGPRMTLQLIKIEEQLCQGKVLFHQFIEKSQKELQEQSAMREKKRKLKEQRKRQQKENIAKKAQEKETHKEKSLAGMKRKAEEENESGEDGDEGERVAEEQGSDEDDDAEYFRQEVGQEPDPEMFSAKRKRQKSVKSNPKRQKLDSSVPKRFRKSKNIEKKMTQKFSKKSDAKTFNKKNINKVNSKKSKIGKTFKTKGAKGRKQ